MTKDNATTKENQSKSSWLEYLKETVEIEGFEAVLSDDPKYNAEDYPFQLSIEQIFPEDFDDDSVCYGCHGGVEGLDNDTLRDINSTCAMNFACEDEAMDVARVMSAAIADEYPEISNIGVLVTYYPYDNEEDAEDSDEPWEHAFFINEFNVWDEEELEGYLHFISCEEES